VESIVISNQAMISSQAVVQALEHNIDIIFLDSFGDPLGRVWFSKMGSTALIRRKQFEGRSRRPAKDPFNAALNYCYGILYSQWIEERIPLKQGL
jgi:CRISPR/Cas system-associated endonuclease Cas1